MGRWCRVDRAVSHEKGQQVILKSLLDPVPAPAVSARFRRCYDLLSSLDHPNIVRPLAWLDQALPPAFVLEDNQSINLLQFLQQQGPGGLSLEVFLTIACQLADALDAIHQQRIVHKDIHPGNVIIHLETLHVRIIDFGIASLVSREQPSLEVPEMPEGHLAYIAPEQTGRMNCPVDYRCDFYSLGCTFYHLLTGAPPFQASDALGLIHAHIAKQPKSLSVLRPDLSESVCGLVEKLLQKSVGERYQSSVALKSDLEKARAGVLFVPGESDFTDRFELPLHLYGRDREIAQLQQCFSQAVEGETTLLVLSGHAGIGKTSLVNEVHKFIAEANGLFCGGKFEPLQQGVPYSALRRALSAWGRHVLAQSSRRLKDTCAMLLNELGGNAGVLTDFMPEFGQIVGQQTAAATLPTNETRNRFHHVLQQFMRVLTHDQPVVLFLDDIQWADAGTLSLLPELVNGTQVRLLIILAYRDAEIDAHHPARETLDRMVAALKNTRRCREMFLQPLNVRQVGMLLQGVMSRSADEVEPLASLITNQTEGVPLFINEWLRILYSRGLLNYDARLRHWVWDITEIQSRGMSETVIHLMLNKMQTLSQACRDLMQWAACFGNRFSLETLGILTGIPYQQVLELLWPAYEEGLLLQDFDYGRFFHDRMQEEAYFSLSLDERQSRHLQIGRYFLRERSSASLQSSASPQVDSFTVAGHFNRANPHAFEAAERDAVIQTNLQAAARAREASAWKEAVNYCEHAMALMPIERWQKDAATAEQLYLIRAECEFLNGHPQRSDEFYQVLLEHVDDALFKARVCADRLSQLIGRGEWPQAMQYGIDGLAYLGVILPDVDQLQTVIRDLRDQLEGKFPDKVVTGLSTLPEMSEPEDRVALHILSYLSQNANILGQHEWGEFYIYLGCQLIVSAGKADLAALHLTMYALLLRRQGLLKEAFRQGQEARAIADSYPDCREFANCYNVLATMTMYLGVPYTECINMHRIAYHRGIENGEAVRAAFNISNSLFAENSRGANLEIQAQHAKIHLQQFREKHFFIPSAEFYWRFSNSLSSMGEGASRGLDDESFDPDYLARLKRSFHYAYLVLLRCQLAFWSGDEACAWEQAQHTQRLWGQLPQASFMVDQMLVFGLLALRFAPKAQQDLEGVLDRLKQFADVYPPNFEHLYLLLKAEVARHQGLDMALTATLYRRCVHAARIHGIVHFQALANERFAEYWLEQEFDFEAEAHLREAMALYSKWGCQARLVYLQTRYPALGSLRDPAQVATSDSTVNVQENQLLDIQSVFKSAQAISEELDLQALTSKIVSVIVENAGATRGVLLSSEGGEAQILAMATSDARIAVLSPELETAADLSDSVPLSMVNFVLRTQETILLDGDEVMTSFRTDSFWARQRPRSVACLPMKYQDTVVGSLYLENTLNEKVFTSDRLRVVNTLLSQAAISLENARLFAEISRLNRTLEEKVEQRTRDLEVVNQQLSRANHDLQVVNRELNAFSYTVSHDLRAPVRNIRAFSQLIREDYSDRLDGTGLDFLRRIEGNTHRMAAMIDGLLELSRIQRQRLALERVDLSALAESILSDLQTQNPERAVRVSLPVPCWVEGDERLLYVMMENLIGNAWKYTSRRPVASIEFGCDKALRLRSADQPWPEEIAPDHCVYYIRDNGEGFDMQYVSRLFGSFQRLHTEKEFPGTGIGLATVRRIVEKHHGQIWGIGEKGVGAVFYFTLGRNEEG